MSYAFSETACCTEGCGEVIVAHVDVDRRRQRTGESFYCPAGHRQHYIVGKTDEQKRIEMLERRIDWRDEQIERMRLAAGSCPWVGCEFQTDSVRWRYDEYDRRPLHAHMRAAHGMPTLAEVRSTDDEEVASA